MQQNCLFTIDKNKFIFCRLYSHFTLSECELQKFTVTQQFPQGTCILLLFISGLHYTQLIYIVLPFIAVG